jgi:hypothetical protein
MRPLLLVCVAACVVLAAGMANAAGQISDNALAQMGLAGLQTMSDAQGAEVRGMGFGVRFVTTQGSASAKGLGACASSSYLAVGSREVAGGAVASVGFGSVSEVLRGCGSITVAKVCGVVAVANSSASAK